MRAGLTPWLQRKLFRTTPREARQSIRPYTDQGCPRLWQLPWFESYTKRPGSVQLSGGGSAGARLWRLSPVIHNSRSIHRNIVTLVHTWTQTQDNWTCAHSRLSLKHIFLPRHPADENNSIFDWQNHEIDVSFI